MSPTPSSPAERRNETRRMVQNLLDERQAMLVSYCHLIGEEPSRDQARLRRRLEEFCQLLVDYLALGHFEIYTRLDEGTERRERVLRIAREIYPRIASLTQEAIAFNDDFDPARNPLDLSDFPRRLSELGKGLAERLELEDRLIGALLAPREAERDLP